jgi:hypothetical protein
MVMSASYDRILRRRGEGRAFFTLPQWIPRQLLHHLKIIGLLRLLLQLIEVGHRLWARLAVQLIEVLHRCRVIKTLDSPW